MTTTTRTHEPSTTHAIADRERHVYAIHESLYPDLMKKLNRIARKCERYGNAYGIEQTGEEYRKDSQGNMHRFIMVSVDGTAIVNGWEFVATLDLSHTGGNVVRNASGTPVPERFRHTPNVCEHCGTSRKRNNLYVIRNVETNEYRQVGGDCLMSYTSGLNLEYVTSWMDGITELKRRSGAFTSGGECYIETERVMSLAVSIIEKAGYFNADSRLSTRSMVCTMLRNDAYASTLEKRVKLLNDELAAYRFDVAFSASDFTTDNSKRVHAIMDYYKKMNDNSEFVHNVQAILSDDYVSYRDLGYICYLPQGYAKHVEQETAKTKHLINRHFGEVGKRYKGIAIEDVRTAGGYWTDYGYTYVYDITVQDGTILTWKTSKKVEGDLNTIDFTVKEHGEYKGNPQTLVTRCKLQ